MGHPPVISFSNPNITADSYLTKVIAQLTIFYRENVQLKQSHSHGMDHALAVYQHATKAIACLKPPPSDMTKMEIQVAALLHDVEDRKYFPLKKEVDKECRHFSLVNALEILSSVGIPHDSINRILFMISLVSCSDNGNSVPREIKETGFYHLLIPRWSDRLEALGAIGIVRCYRYTKEKGSPLSTAASPRAKTPEEVWNYAIPSRFEEYQRLGTSEDMISHYFDKLLHIARPPKDIVWNEYLEKAAGDSAKELVEVCVRFGRTGMVDEAYIQSLEKSLGVAD